ncbi:hypothetical protein ASG90_06765 [Nocardioides sp. Soil797]|nr:hypothetical protein ASG90_06765 [Nocardioides sp. Soil797]
MLGLGLSAPPTVHAEQGQPTQKQSGAKPDSKVTARIDASGIQEVATTADGRFLVALKKDRLVRYRITPSKIRKVGSSGRVEPLNSDVRSEGLAVHPSGKFAYVGVGSGPQNKKKYAVLVLRIDRPTPKLVKKISIKDVHPGKGVNFRGMTMRPDGKRLYLTVGKDLATFKMGNGARGKLQAVETGQLLEVGPGRVATPDGTKLITGVRKKVSRDFLRYRIWDISGTGAPVPGPEQRIDTTAFDVKGVGRLARIVPAPGNTTAFVHFYGWDHGSKDYVVKIDLATGEILVFLGADEAVGAPSTMSSLLGRSPSGDRIYVSDLGSQQEPPPITQRALARSDAGLATYERLKGRFALERVFAVSPAGKTKGLVYTVTIDKKDHSMQLVSIRN